MSEDLDIGDWGGPLFSPQVPGDMVTVRDYLQGRYRAVVEECYGSTCVVRRVDGQRNTVPSWTLTTIYCLNCGYSLSAHAEGHKCIYGPGEWEAPC